MMISDMGNKIVPVFIVKFGWRGQDSSEQISDKSELRSSSLLLYDQLPQNITSVLKPSSC